jgi:hypothetical protein
LTYSKFNPNLTPEENLDGLICTTATAAHLGVIAMSIAFFRSTHSFCLVLCLNSKMDRKLRLFKFKNNLFKNVQFKICSNLNLCKFKIYSNLKSVQFKISSNSNLFKFKRVQNLKTIQTTTIRILNSPNLDLFRSKKKNGKKRETKQKENKEKMR